MSIAENKKSFKMLCYYIMFFCAAKGGLPFTHVSVVRYSPQHTDDNMFGLTLGQHDVRHNYQYECVTYNIITAIL